MKFYDHASNHTRAAVASAVARARRSAIADGTAYRVEFLSSKGAAMFWDGCRYDAIQLAKDLHRSPSGGPVKLLNPAGEAVDIEAARY